jgi:predicted transcriptional regulator
MIVANKEKIDKIATLIVEAGIDYKTANELLEAAIEYGSEMYHSAKKTQNNNVYSYKPHLKH